MSLSSIRYRSALNRFNSKKISNPVNNDNKSSDTQKTFYKGYNPETDKIIIENIKGENIEVVNNIQGRTSQSIDSLNIIHQGHVVG
ncbi:MAG: hypothetical protein ACKPFF_38975 [Planktothrix sp.]